jgi:glycosyltransferase involved in cell wall biosynthesis
MRILLLACHPFFQQRGTPIAVKALLEVLSREGHAIDVLTFHEGEDVEVPNCRILRIPAVPGTRGMRPGFSVKKLVCDGVMLGKLLALLRRERYDLVHAVEESAFMALVARRLFGVPYVYDMDSELSRQLIDRMPLLRYGRRGLEWCERRAVRGSVGVLAVCRSVEERARRYYPECRISRIEDFSLLEPPATGGEGSVEVERLADLPDPAGTRGPIALYVGNLQPYQGIDLLLEGWVHAGARVPGARLVIVGGAPEHIAHYRGRALELGIGESVHFLGPRPVERLGDYLRQATVLASPRIQGENTPMKIYSYLDSGRPLVATRLPTHTQVLDDEVACLTAPDPASFGEGLARLLESEPLRERLGAAACRYAQREFTPAAFEAKLLGFYRDVERHLGSKNGREAGRQIGEVPHGDDYESDEYESDDGEIGEPRPRQHIL